MGSSGVVSGRWRVSWDAPRTWVDDELVAGQYGNQWRDDMDYIHGGQAGVDAITVTTTASAAVGDGSLSVIAITNVIPSDTILAFTDGTGDAHFVRLNHAAERGATALFVHALADVIGSGETAYYPAQDFVALQAQLQVTGGLQWPVAPFWGEMRQQTIGLGTASLRYIGEKSTGALADAEYSEFVFVLRKGDGTEEELAKIRAFRDGSAAFGSVYIFTAASGAYRASPDIVLHHTGAVWIGFPASPVGTLDINGDIDADGYVGLAIWRETPSGTLNHVGTATITGQLRSTAASGIPIACGSTAGMVRNLNAQKVNGFDWADAAVTDSSTQSVSGIATPYTIGTATTTEAGRHKIRAEADITLDTGDEGARFTFTVPGQGRDEIIRLLTAGARTTVSITTLYNATSAEDLDFTVQKDAGSGSTSVAGSITATRYGQ
jgi:hypothetical protein